MNKLRDSQELEELGRLDKANRLIKLDYPYHPKRRPWTASKSKIFEQLDSGRNRYSELLKSFSTFTPNFENIQIHPSSPRDLSPRWLNGWFPPLDGICLYGLLALNNPRRYVEVGSGNSTMFAHRAIKDHGLRTLITSIDPHPRTGIDRICDIVIREPCEDLPPEFFDSLSSEDILFVDNSHRAFSNSDVTVFFTEILPNLPSDMIYGIHDIFLPSDYPSEWKDRYYNEQYLLAAYLNGGAHGDVIISPNAFLSYYDPQQLTPLAGTWNSVKLQGIKKTGVAFWMRRV